jgi:hypothetical protein
MHTIARNFFIETSLHTFTAEVAELVHGKQLEGRKGLPKKIIIPNVGNGNPFAVVEVQRNEGDLMWAKYRQLFGCCEAIIFND